MAKKKCKHVSSTRLDKITGKIFEVGICTACGSRFSLGESNDVPAEVQIEMRAAELDYSRRAERAMETFGYVAHRDHLTPSIDIERAGWLAREMATHNDRETRDATAWPWDPSRPVAGQYEAWEYERHRAAEPDCRDEDEDDPPADHDDIPIRAGAPEAIGLTPRQLREQTAAGVAAEDEIREHLRAGVEDGGQS